MSQTSRTATATRAPAPPLGRVVHANRSTAELYEDAVRAGEGMIAADGPLVVRTGRHTGRSPKDKFVVREPSSAGKVWWGEVNQPISEEHYDRLRARLVEYVANKSLFAQDCHIGAHPGHRRSLRVYTETAWASIFARNLFRRPSDEDLAAFKPNFTIINVPVVQGRSRDRGHPQRDRDPRPSQADGGDHRRHRVRRRDQEVGVHGHELPPARRGRPADALGGQRRRGARLRRVLRALGDRQDDAVGRSRAEPHRRRRARLGRRRRVQLRGRLLRQDDPPLADVRAGHLPDDEALRDDPRERRARSADAGARPRLRPDHREHPRRLPARVHRQRRPDRDRRPAEERRAADGRRVRDPAADLAADARPGGLPLHQRLHGEARGHRGRGQGAAGDVLGLLRGAVHAPPPGRVRRDADRASGAVGRAGLARQHRLDGRALRHGRADEHQPHPDDGPRRAERGA